MVRTTASHQSAGSCSAQPFCGCIMGYSTVAEADVYKRQVLKNATYVNVFSNELCHGDIAVVGGLVVGMGDYAGETEYDMTGKIVVPGFIDAHIHLESSLVTPAEFARAVLPHGTTTVVTDPHEIANVCGVKGIDYMLQATQGLPLRCV